MNASQAPHATPHTLSSGNEIKSVAFLGQMPAATYANLPPKMQKACRIMVENGEMTIEGEEIARLNRTNEGSQHVTVLG